METEEIEARVLYKLARHRKWGASHTSFDNIQKGFKSHERKEAKQAGNNLIKIGLILQKPTSYGLEISLNPSAKSDIIQKIEKFFKDSF